MSANIAMSSGGSSESANMATSSSSFESANNMSTSSGSSDAANMATSPGGSSDPANDMPTSSGDASDPANNMPSTPQPGPSSFVDDSSSKRYPILSPGDALVLAGAGLLRSAGRDGWQQLHKRRVTWLQWTNIPAIDSVPLDSRADNAFLPIPDTLISRETLSYVGYDEAKADELWGRWSRWSPSEVSEAGHLRREIDEETGGLGDMDAVTFEDFIVLRGSDIPDTMSEGDAGWTTALAALGLTPSAQADILNTAINTQGLGRSARWWARDLVRMRYGSLRDMRRASRQREATLTDPEAGRARDVPTRTKERYVPKPIGYERETKKFGRLLATYLTDKAKALREGKEMTGTVAELWGTV